MAYFYGVKNNYAFDSNWYSPFKVCDIHLQVQPSNSSDSVTKLRADKVHHRWPKVWLLAVHVLMDMMVNCNSCVDDFCLLYRALVLVPRSFWALRNVFRNKSDGTEDFVVLSRLIWIQYKSRNSIDWIASWFEVVSIWSYINPSTPENSPSAWVALQWGRGAETQMTQPEFFKKKILTLMERTDLSLSSRYKHIRVALIPPKPWRQGTWLCAKRELRLPEE